MLNSQPGEPGTTLLWWIYQKLYAPVSIALRVTEAHRLSLHNKAVVLEEEGSKSLFQIMQLSVNYGCLGAPSPCLFKASNSQWNCLLQNLTVAGLDSDWRVTAVNNDSQGLEFISSFEHKQYPIYGVQFHPEKNGYEWKKTNNNPHTANAILVQQYFANFFVNEGNIRLFLILICCDLLFLSILSLSPPASLFASFMTFSIWHLLTKNCMDFSVSTEINCEDLGIGWRIILKCIFKGIWREGVDWIHVDQNRD